MSENIDRGELLRVTAIMLTGIGVGQGGNLAYVTVEEEKMRRIVTLAEKAIKEVDSRYNNTAELKVESSFDRDTLVNDDEFIDETLNNS